MNLIARLKRWWNSGKVREATPENNLSGRYILALRRGEGADSVAAHIIRKKARKLAKMRAQVLKVRGNVVAMKSRRRRA